jgi:hypothetical protein
MLDYMLFWSCQSHESIHEMLDDTSWPSTYKTRKDEKLLVVLITAPALPVVGIQ